MRTLATSEHLDSLRLFWEEYARATPGIQPVYAVWTLGDGPALADELAAMVVDGSKRASAGLLRDFASQNEPLPRTGDHVILVDGQSTPRCVICITRVEVNLIRDVDERFVQKNGGGDGSIAWWLTANLRYFKRQGTRQGFAVDDRTEVVFVDFVVVWPMQPGVNG
ncbi:MAG TPA: ASCH domain-containing protein [Candidatus Binatia bacterium]|nr:ASCH domain-containing protein [Candidatus Binatia bacterium]